jgi:hypothetical protein
MTIRTKFAQLRQAVVDAWIECYLNDDEKQEMLDFIEELKLTQKIKSIPEALEYGTNCNNLSYADGWNDCLKEMGLLK